MIRTLFLTCCLLSILQQFGYAQNPEGFDQMCATNIKGTVPFISSEELLVEIDDGSEILIMDIRERGEYDVSHLPQAQTGLAPKGVLRNKKLKEIPKDAEIRLYASIGIRSELVGEKLLEAGYVNVKNLYGGIFSWANQGHPMVDKEGESTIYLHGFTKSWSGLINIYQCKPVFK